MTQRKPRKTSPSPNDPATPSHEVEVSASNTHPHRDPVVEALRILARRGQQVLEAEAAARAAAEGGAR